MNYAQARVLRILVPLQIGSNLLIKSSGESTSRNAQQQRTPSARMSFLVSLALTLVCLPVTSLAQPVALTPPQLDQLVARIALYPDPLLAQVLTASTYWSEIPEAAAWADEHSYLKGDALAQAILADHLQWDPSILALLPFPSVLDMMARDPAWTEQLGNAVLTQNPDVMDAVQRMRQRARSYGYLTTNGYINVIANGGISRSFPSIQMYFMCPIMIRSSSSHRRDQGSRLRVQSVLVQQSPLAQYSVDGDGG